MKKTLLVNPETHRDIKSYCDGRNLKIMGTIDLIIKEGIRVMKIKEQNKAAI
jgi:hypothetical protein